jgi:transposase
MMTMTSTTESSAWTPTSSSSPTILLVFELGERSWRLGFTTGMGQRPRIRVIAAGAVESRGRGSGTGQESVEATGRDPVVSCFEAGKEDGFWLHRWLLAQGVTNHVLDSY